MKNEGGLGKVECVSIAGGGGDIGGGNTIVLYLQYKKCDISLITRDSNRQVSHSPLIKILLRVISKGRDKIVEIGSN